MITAYLIITCLRWVLFHHSGYQEVSNGGVCTRHVIDQVTSLIETSWFGTAEVTMQSIGSADSYSAFVQSVNDKLQKNVSEKLQRFQDHGFSEKASNLHSKIELILHQKKMFWCFKKLDAIEIARLKSKAPIRLALQLFELSIPPLRWFSRTPIINCILMHRFAIILQKCHIIEWERVTARQEGIERPGQRGRLDVMTATARAQRQPGAGRWKITWCTAESNWQRPAQIGRRHVKSEPIEDTVLSVRSTQNISPARKPNRSCSAAVLIEVVLCLDCLRRSHRPFLTGNAHRVRNGWIRFPHMYECGH